jgi:gamma-glutamylcyclotransferase (GGCT)/AIG2-like uncharacterized protein YtfP
MNPYLFVYGSLMSTARHPMGARLRREARLIGPASTQGRLYRISWYPGLVESDDPAARVYGEAYRLNNPSRTLAWLDRYEGTASGVQAKSEYLRREQIVRLESGEEIKAWLYSYRASVAGKRYMPSGRWVADSR